MNNLLDKYRSFLEDPREIRSVLECCLQGRTLKDSSDVSHPKKRLSNSTVKNYLSDTRHFLSFLTTKLQKTDLQATDITSQAVSAYQQSLASALEQVAGASKVPNLVLRSKPKKVRSKVKSPVGSELRKVTEPSQIHSKPSLATTNRRLSSLRRFGHFLFVTKQLPADPTTTLTNLKNQPKSTTIRQIINQYKNHLKDEALSKSTIKNYLSDLNSYLLWAKENYQLTDSHSHIRA